MHSPRIVAMGGGGFSMEPRNPRLDRWLLGLTGRRKPRVLFLPTASGDARDYIERFYRAFSRHRCEPSHLALFNRTVVDLRKFVLAQDLIYVGGGNTANMLAVWRVHGLDELLREAWLQGTVLCGVSAGAICWFRGGVTDSFGQELQPLKDGLGFLPGSFCPHYDNEPRRRPAFHHLVAARSLPAGYAADDSVGLLFENTELVDVATSRPGKSAFRVKRTGNAAEESSLPARLLPTANVGPARGRPQR